MASWGARSRRQQLDCTGAVRGIRDPERRRPQAGSPFVRQNRGSRREARTGECSSLFRVRPLQRPMSVPWRQGINQGGTTEAVSSLSETASLVFREKDFGMPRTISRTYNPREHEERLYAWWETQGFFRPETQAALGQSDPDKAPFVIAMPPPNVTGALHLGHAIMDAVEDFLIRYKRMQGFPTLWVPGTDHAGIATQSVVEKHLEEAGQSREALGRKAFEAEVWDWKAEYHDRISNQQRRMGISCDWERERFTLDPGLSHAVRASFVRLYEEGLIYRGTYLVNWSPRLQTAVSDLEVEYQEEEGTLYSFKYCLQDSDEFIPVATTRPETILGDTAVAVHPEDERYRRFIGRQAVVPLLGRTVPVIADSAVDREFGTGALKITPGHDHTDYAIGQRHGLPSLAILDRDARLTQEAGPFAGLTREEGRQQVWNAMKTQGLTLGTAAHTVRVPRSQRGGEIIEPMLSTQWFVRMHELAQAAAEAVRTGRIEIVPRRFESVYFHWLDNIRDWCISRQLWWGHRIPVWYGPDGHMFCALDEDGARQQALAHYGTAKALVQDEDVLDTWYSSGLWPFSILGWPQETPDMARYYPNTVLETGYDILFFWVARMIMMGLKLTGDIPFRTVYLHGLVRAESGEKMSKSLGNAEDPLDIVHVCGADALRLTLLTGITPGNDLKMNQSRLENSRNFANKMWNAFRFLATHLPEEKMALAPADNPFATTYALPATQCLGLAERWLLARLHEVTGTVTRLVDSWQIGEAGTVLHGFLWHEMCDWYLEAAKVTLNGPEARARQATVAVLAYTLEQSLRLLHPFMPFLTEAIWQELPQLAASVRSLMLAHWPTGGVPDEQAVTDFRLVQKLVRAVRNIRSEYRIDPGRRLAATVVSPQHVSLFDDSRDMLCALARLDASRLAVTAEQAITEPCITLAVEAVTVYIPWAGIVDLAAERARLTDETVRLQAQLDRSQQLMANTAFVTKAPAAVVERERQKIARLVRELEQVSIHLRELGF